MNKKEYWRECVAQSAEESGAKLTQEQVDYIAESVEGAHENIGMAFYEPPASDRMSVIEGEWKAKYQRLEKQLENYRHNSETAIKQALGCHSDDNVSIGEYGEVLRHGGRTERIQ